MLSLHIEFTKAFITMYHSSSSVFMTNKAHYGVKSIAKVPNQKVAKRPKHSFFSLSTYFFKRASS